MQYIFSNWQVACAMNVALCNQSPIYTQDNIFICAQTYENSCACVDRNSDMMRLQMIGELRVTLSFLASSLSDDKVKIFLNPTK